MIRSRRPLALLWLSLLAALFMRAFVPMGYMPERTDTGAITVRVCGAGHVLQIPVGKSETPGKTGLAEPPCAFAGLGTPALPPPAAVAALAPQAVARGFARADTAGSSRTNPLRLPPARGPPPAA